MQVLVMQVLYVALLQGNTITKSEDHRTNGPSQDQWTIHYHLQCMMWLRYMSLTFYLMWLVVTEVQSASARGAPWRVLLQHSVMLQCYVWASLLSSKHYIFHRWVWYRALSLRDACILCLDSSSSPRLPTFAPNVTWLWPWLFISWLQNGIAK